jgi:hypothetical protein
VGKPVSGSRTDRLRAARRTRRRAVLAATTGLAVGLGILFSTSSTADTRLLHILDAAKREPVRASPTAVSLQPTMPKPPRTGATASPSAKPRASVTASASAPAATSASAAAAPAAEPPVTTIGDSENLTQNQQPSQVGALFSGGVTGSHYCTASVVDSPAGDIIVAAAHCLSEGPNSSDVFVPAYRNGSAPYGVWHLADVVESSAWTSDQDPDDDVAFAVVSPLDGRSLESVVGSYTLDTEGVSSGQVQLTGYPEDSNEPISCSGDSTGFSATQLQVYCTDYTSGTSGSGWVADYDPATGSGSLVGVIGGYEAGGDTADVSYSPVFGSDVRVLYDQAISIAG